MKKLIIALSAVLMTAGFVSCDEDSLYAFADGFAYGYYNSAPAYHGEPSDSIDVEDPILEEEYSAEEGE